MASTPDSATTAMADASPPADAAPVADSGLATADAASGKDAALSPEAAPGGDAETCPFPRPQIIDGVATGFVGCDGFTERVEQRSCPSRLPRPPAPHPAGPTSSCASDADCTAKPLGYCARWSGFSGSGWACVYGCLEDKDCGPKEICQCGDPVGSCVSSTCTSSASCEPGRACASGSSDNGCSPRFACQTASDQCRTSAQCQALFGEGNTYCAVTATGRACRSRPADVGCQ